MERQANDMIQGHMNSAMFGMSLTQSKFVPENSMYVVSPEQAYNMARVKLGNETLDTANISGAKLAEIGRQVLAGKKVVDQIKKDVVNEYGIREGDYTAKGWLDMRIEEICRKGRL